MRDFSRTTIMVLLLITLLVSVSGAFLIVHKIGGEEPQQIGQTTGEVNLYVMPKPTTESGEIKLNVISKEQR
ncbi:MAG: hypothetical protein KJ623_03310 [Nanoarchaeota archaeon]|nr:hypothetical protein [Nanoarchaeota archaeon]MBU0962846.1 hypothetical protein [Nanoarchaeota archaeon]